MSKQSHSPAAVAAAFLVFTIVGSASGQVTIAPGFQQSVVATGIPGTQHQVAAEASGVIWVGEEGVTPGFGPGAMHRVDAAGTVLP